jgi:hypothetical protein
MSRQGRPSSIMVTMERRWPSARRSRFTMSGWLLCKCEGVAVAARNQYRTAALLFLCGSGGKTIIRLEAGRFRSARG